MAVIEILAIVDGFAGTVFSSQRAVTAAVDLATRLRVRPFIIGFTLLALGTDLPEIANSIAASLTDHGDVNVGDSVGSAATQITLVLGLLPLIVGPIDLVNGKIWRTGVLTVLALAVLGGLVSDDLFGRLDALVLLSLWLIGFWIIHRHEPVHHQLAFPEPIPAWLPLMGKIIVAFAGLAVSASVALWGVVGLAERLDVSEFIVAFFIASLGTSLPELVFDVTALRRGAVAMAIGDIVGSSFIDATLSVGIGPLIAPTEITSDVVLRGIIVSAVAVGFVTLVLSRVHQHD